jgi:hypothetical protein
MKGTVLQATGVRSCSEKFNKMCVQSSHVGILCPLCVMSALVRITKCIVFLVSRAARMQARVTARVRSHRAADSPSPGSPSPSRDSPRLNSPRYANPPFPDENHKEEKTIG